MSTKTKAILAVMAGDIIFGFSFLFSKLALEITIPSVLIATRFITAFAVLNIIVLFGKLIKKKDHTPFIDFHLKGKPIKHLLLLALFQPVIYFIAENYGIVYTSSAFAGILIAAIPIAGIILDVIIMHSPVSIRQIVCAILSVVGVAITAIGATDMRSSAKGVIVLIIAVIAGAMFYVFSKKAGEYYNPLERTYAMFGIGSVVYLALALIQTRGSYHTLIVGALTNSVFWGSILYLAIVSSVIAFLLLNFGSNHISVSSATIFANMTTVISIFAGIFILHESFSWQQGVGAVVILASVYFANTSSKAK